MSFGLDCGLDFGSSRVKVTIQQLKGQTSTRASLSFGWHERGLRRTATRDWHQALEYALSAACDLANDFGEPIERLVCSTVGPNFAFISPITAASGPLLQYDAWSADVFELPQGEPRTLAALLELSNACFLAPSGHGELVTGSSWLAWQLTGLAVQDRHGYFEGYVDSQDIAWVVPNRISYPGDLIGKLSHEWIRERVALKDCDVILGGTDSTSLALAIEHLECNLLLYMGTFFSVLELTDSVSSWIREPSLNLPYRWHISMPIGALLEHLANAGLSRADITQLIAEQIESAAESKNKRIVPISVALPSWEVGRSGFQSPKIRGVPQHAGHVVQSVFEDFSTQLNTLLSHRQSPDLLVGGGFATNERVRQLASYAGRFRLPPDGALDQASSSLSFLNIN